MDVIYSEFKKTISLKYLHTLPTINIKTPVICIGKFRFYFTLSNQKARRISMNQQIHDKITRK